MSSDPVVPVQVQVGDIEYRLTCPASEEPALRAAAEQLASAMDEVREGGRVRGGERLAVMAGLRLSYDLLRLKSDAERVREDSVRRIGDMLGRLEIALSQGRKIDV